MTPWLDDGDVRLYHGDVLDTLRQLPDESVDCVVTSPPYWGLRDYGTGEWAGGDPDCDHIAHKRAVGPERYTEGGNLFRGDKDTLLYEGVCGKCGATRVDKQLGLEPTPDLFVQNMVEVFREVRRVLAYHGTCWVNLGDSYATSGGNDRNGSSDGQVSRGDRPDERLRAGLKPKDLVGIPWRVAFALQADGWYLRSDIVWAKPNPMPESVTDRPTKSHEYVFLLTKQPRYWFDAEAVRERYTDPREGGEGFRWDSERYTNQSAAQSNHTPTGKGPDGRKVTKVEGRDGSEQHRNGERWPAGRNVRSVWNIATQPYPEAHFATFPEELARRCIVAGCPTRVCRVCGKPSERIVDVQQVPDKGGGSVADRQFAADPRDSGRVRGWGEQRTRREVETLGWSDCGHNNWRPGVVLDPFMGSGTVAKVARDHQRHAIGIDLNRSYLELAARRLQQLSLLT